MHTNKSTTSFKLNVLQMADSDKNLLPWLQSFSSWVDKQFKIYTKNFLEKFSKNIEFWKFYITNHKKIILFITVGGKL